jgi:glucokinase
VYITVSTGVGGGVVNDGRLLLGKQGLGAEAGHIMLLLEGGRVSSLEREASGTWMAHKVREQLASGAKSSILNMVDHIDQVDSKIVGRAALEGDELAVNAVEYTGFCVGLGVVTLLHLFNPEIVVIGGGVTNIGALLMDKIKQTVKKHSLDEAYWRDLKIVNPLLGGDVSIIGAGALVVTEGGQSDIQKIAELVNQ